LNVAVGRDNSIRFVFGGLELVAIAMCIPFVILFIGTPFALAGRLVIEIITRLTR
jgi:hypothetical protein